MTVINKLTIIYGIKYNFVCTGLCTDFIRCSVCDVVLVSCYCVLLLTVYREQDLLVAVLLI